MLIRPAKSTDIDGIVSLLVESDRLHIGGQPRVFREDRAPEARREELNRLVQEPSTALLVAEDDGRVVGMAQVDRIDQPARGTRHALCYAMLQQLAVAEHRRKEGIGTKLTKAAEDWARAQGVDEMRLHVWEFNADAIGLYQGCGFQTLSRIMSRSLV